MLGTSWRKGATTSTYYYSNVTDKKKLRVKEIAHGHQQVSGSAEVVVQVLMT